MNGPAWRQKEHYWDVIIFLLGEPPFLSIRAGLANETKSLAIAFRKPNGMRFINYIETSGLALAEAQATASDSSLIYVIRIQRLAEEVGSAFGYGEPEGSIILGAERIQLSVRAFRTQLQQIMETWPVGISKSSKNPS